jgi:hypothetical protein
MRERYIVLPKRYDPARRQQVFGVWDSVRAFFVSESYSNFQCKLDADYLNEISQPEEEKQNG